MKPVVIDASALLAWLLGDDPSLAAAVEAAIESRDTSQGAALIAPVLLRAEVANALTTAWRRQRITAALASQAAVLAEALPIDYEPATAPIPSLLSMAQAHGLTAYDAQYLELAMRRDARMMTAERTLIDAAGKAGVAVVPT